MDEQFVHRTVEPKCIAGARDSEIANPKGIGSIGKCDRRAAGHHDAIDPALEARGRTGEREVVPTIGEVGSRGGVCVKDVADRIPAEEIEILGLKCEMVVIASSPFGNQPFPAPIVSRDVDEGFDRPGVVIEVRVRRVG